MGELPKEVLEYALPFQVCTLDYLGPVPIKRNIRRLRSNLITDNLAKETFDKCWVLLISCYSTGGYHLEVVPDLTANAFLKAFGNFVATRGFPTKIRSDNASNFLRARDVLKEAYECYKKSLIEGDKAIREKFAVKGVEWTTNPPLGSWFGGRHERGIRTVRDLLKKSIGNTRLDFSDLHAALKQVEMMLNSRPILRAIGSHDEGDFHISPSMLMIGRNLTTIPSVKFSTPNASLFHSYQKRIKIQTTFWKLFHKAHLQEIQHRVKWHETFRDLKVGDLVMEMIKSCQKMMSQQIKIAMRFYYEDQHGLRKFQQNSVCWVA